MSASIPDIYMNGTWQNANSLTGIAIGKAMYIQNKSSTPILLYLSNTPPSAVQLDGILLTSNSVAFTGNGDPTLWIYGQAGRVCVQVN